jgi:hypothetical protein
VGTYFGVVKSQNWVYNVGLTGKFYYTGSASAKDFGFPEGWQKVS